MVVLRRRRGEERLSGEVRELATRGRPRRAREGRERVELEVWNEVGR